MATPQNTSSLLLFRVGPVFCSAPSLAVDSIILPPPLNHPPGSNPAKPGIFRHSGHIISCLDLRYQFGVEQTQWVTPGRMVITQLSKGRVGFWIDEILEVIEPPASGWGPLPPLLPRGVFSKTLLYAKEIYLYADFEALYKIPRHGYLQVYIQQLLEQQARKTTPTPSKTTTPSDVANASQPDATNIQHRDDTTPIPSNVTTQKPTPTAASGKQNHGEHDQPSSYATKNPTLSSAQSRATSSMIAKAEQRTADADADKPPAQTANVTKVIPAAMATGQHKHPPAMRQTKTEPSSHGPAPGMSKANTPHRNTAPIKTRNVDTTSHAAKPSPVSLNTANRRIHNKDVREDKNTSLGLFFTFFLFALLAGAAWLVWTLAQPELLVIHTNDKNQMTNSTKAEAQITTRPESTFTTDMTADDVVTETEATDTLPEARVHTETTQPAYEQTKSASTNAGDITGETEQNAVPTTAREETPVSKPQTPSYRASIEQDTQGLTIMIDAPDDVDVFKSNETKPEVENVEPTMLVNNTTPETSAALPEPAPTAPSTQTKAVLKTEIVHTVVKGDTLWHIAIRYLNNPFLYPELARLSKIKNPDLIYPGNQVRIVKRRKTPDN